VFSLGLNFDRDGPFTLGVPPGSPQPYDGSTGSIAVSAGIRGAQLVLAPQDYLRATQATVGPIARAQTATDV